MNAFLKFAPVSLFAGVAAVMAQGIPALPPTPAPVLDLISAQPIILNQPYAFDWSAERPQVSAGYLLVLSVNPDYVFARQTEEPILFVGSGTAERINNGYESGKVVAFVPSAVDEKGQLTLDLKTSMIWFGTPGLPEQVDAAMAASEVTLAQRAGIQPFSAAKVNQALAAGGNQLQLADKVQLLGEAGKAILAHSPQEKDLADNFLTISGAKPQPKPGKSPARTTGK